MVRPSVQVLLDDGSATFSYDITNYVDLRAGISITRGRQDEFTEVQPSTCSMTLDNSDGRFTFGLAKPAGANLLTNGSFEGGKGGWAPEPTASIARSTAQAWVGAASLALTAGSADAYVKADRVAVTAGQAYTIQGRARSATTVRSFYYFVKWYDVAGVNLSNNTSPGSTAAPSGSFGYRADTFTAPANAVMCEVQVYLTGPPSVGEVFYFDALKFEQGSSATAYSDPWPPVRVDTPIQVRVSIGASTSVRFTGYVNTWPVTWPGGNRYTEVQITANDRLARLARRKLRSVLEQTILTSAPEGYYLLAEGTGSASAGDTSGSGLGSLVATQKGTAGTLEFGAGTGPRTDGHTAATFTPAGPQDGLYLTGLLGKTVLRSSSSWWVRCSVSTTQAIQQTFVTLEGTNIAFLGTNALGYLRAVGNTMSAVDTASLADGAVHDVVFVADAGANLARLYRDGVQVATGAYSIVYAVVANRLSVGGNASSGYDNADATISHVAFGSGVPSAATVADWYTAGSDGFTADSSDERITRYASWAGAADAVATEVGDLTAVAHQDTGGMSVATAMQNVAASEQGLLFINGAGQIVFHSRSHRYAPGIAVTLDAHAIGADSTFALDTQGLTNSVTVSREGGATQIYEVASSVAKYEQYPSDLSLLVTTDDEALLAASWVANINAEPMPRLSSVPVDLLTQTSADALDMQELAIGDAISITGLPSQAPASSVTLFLEGWTEDIGAEVWAMTFNTSPLNTVWKLQDSVSGAIDSTFRLAY